MKYHSAHLRLRRAGLLLSSLLLCCTASAHQPTMQEQAQAILMQGARINHFNRLCPQEKVYLHFDNTAYFQGETIWFSAHVTKATEGTVADVWEDEKLGTCIRVEHRGGLESVYANLSPQPTVKVGDPMGIGAILGAVGTTANAESGMAPHLHLEVFRDGESIDPMELLPEK